MRKDQCFKLGKVTNTKGFKGDLVVYIEVGDPKDFTKMESVFVELNNKLIPFFIDTYHISSKNSVSMRLDNVDEILSKQLVGAALYLPEEMLPEESGFLVRIKNTIGFTVIDENLGKLGTIEDFYEIPNNPLLAFSYQEKEVLLPLRMVQIDESTKEVITDLPEGYLEL